jgi:amino acid transporter
MGGFVVFFAVALLGVGVLGRTGFLPRFRPSPMSPLLFGFRVVATVVPLALIGVGLLKLRK